MAASIPIKKIHVLIVEDEEAFREAMSFEFERRGFLVSSACNGVEALKILTTSQVDVVVSDILMPECGGIELLDRLKSLNPTLPIVMLMTGYSEISTDVACAKGAEALFSKPFDRQVLIDSVTKLVAKRNENLMSGGSILVDLKVRIHFGGERGSLETCASKLYGNAMFVPLERNFPEVCDSVSFDLQFCDRVKWVGASGVVKWVSFKAFENAPAGIGIEFSSLSENRRVQLKDLIKSR